VGEQLDYSDQPALRSPSNMCSSLSARSTRADDAMVIIAGGSIFHERLTLYPPAKLPEGG